MHWIDIISILDLEHALACCARLQKWQSRKDLKNTVMIIERKFKENVYNEINALSSYSNGLKSGLC